jgi:anion-transporting  ArsA/GET3 family ATPase
MQFDMITAQKEEENKRLLAEIAPLKRMVEQLVGTVNELREERTMLLKMLEDKDRQLQKMELLQHQYDELQRLVYSRSSEKSAAVVSPEQLRLGMEAEAVEACRVQDGQRVGEYTKQKAQREKHPGRNEIPAHIERKYIDLHPEGMPEDAELFDKIETE